jgi:hypothetical protein
MKVKFLDEYYPVGGDYLLHSVNNWIALANVDSQVIEAELYDSSWQPKGDAFIKLTKAGIEDAGEGWEKKQEAKQATKEEKKGKQEVTTDSGSGGFLTINKE